MAMLNCHNLFRRSITPLDDLRGEFDGIFLLILSPLFLERLNVFKLTKKTSPARMAKDFTCGVKIE
jgi:hypothetical protein